MRPEEARKSRTDRDESDDPEERDQERKRQSGGCHESVKAEDINDYRPEQRERKWHVAVQKKQHGGNELRKKYDDQVVGRNERPQKLPGDARGRRHRNKVQKAVEAENDEYEAGQNSGDGEGFTHGLTPLNIWASCLTERCIHVNYIDVNITDEASEKGIQAFMKKTSSEPVHVWLVMMKAIHAITKCAARDIYQESGLGDSDFRVLEVLLHKGPLPVNTIGPKVNLTPGSISVAVDRLHTKGLVRRDESSDDRRVRVVALTRAGKDLIAPLFEKHAALMKDIFSELDPDELMRFEAALRRVGLRAQALAELGAAVA